MCRDFTMGSRRNNAVRLTLVTPDDNPWAAVRQQRGIPLGAGKPSEHQCATLGEKVERNFQHTTETDGVICDVKNKTRTAETPQTDGKTSQGGPK